MSNSENSAKGFITFTVVFEAMSLNRDEGLGNIQSLHLLTRGNGNVYSYMSRQALTYSVRKFLIESNVWKESPVGKAGSVWQYKGDIKQYEEIDLFGYLITDLRSDDKSGKGSADVRPAAVTFTHAVSLEPYGGDIGFYANHEMVRRGEGTPNPYNRQEHKSLYKYSVVIDLNRVSKDDHGDEVQDSEKAKTRLTQLMDAAANLHHQVAAYREPLYPLFIAAARTKYGSPIFHNYVELSGKKEESGLLNANLFEKGLLHANSILKDETCKAVWALLEGSGALHLGMSSNSLNGKKDIPLDVIAEVKNWIEMIYPGKNQ